MLLYMCKFNSKFKRFLSFKVVPCVSANLFLKRPVYLIKFGGPFVSFDSHKESTLVKGGVIEYSKDEETGKFGPGVTDKKPGRQLKLYLAARKSYKQKKR